MQTLQKPEFHHVSQIAAYLFLTSLIFVSVDLALDFHRLLDGDWGRETFAEILV